ncbi:MAG: hypothetical protein H0U13_04730, partial [Gemmatimonadaceae bacterium]|nr:hypothetical protein [Gemmatimonadaceae bacterium]
LEAFEDLSEAAHERIRRLDGALADMSGPEFADLWTVVGLRSQPEWSEIRRLAGEALDTLARDKGGDSDSSDIARR